MIENKQQGSFLIDSNFAEFGPAIIPRAAKSADSTQRPHSGFLRISNLESLLGQQVFWILPAARKLPARTYCQSRVILRGNMSVIISMLRGVNVGGHNKIKMDQLRAVYESLGFRDAQTYIQSGNVVSRADKRDPGTACTRIEKGIERHFGFRPSVIVRTASELREVIVRNPFAKRSGMDASRLLVAFLAGSPAADALDKVLKIKCEPQELRVSGRELFIYFPNGLARPTLPMATVERTLKIAFTGRNWNTVRKLLEMAEALEQSAKK